jgi:hypothetical protein
MDDPAGARETLHVLANSLGTVRVWLAVLENTPPRERAAIMDEALAKLNHALGGAENACQRLRDLRPK